MGIAAIKQWRDERYRLLQLRHEIDHIHSLFDPRFEAAQKSALDRDYVNMLHAELSHETEHLEDEYYHILTSRMLRAAARYGVPVPRYDDDSAYWQWSRYRERALLTIEGLAYLRREIAFERDIRHKPLLTWGSFAISVVSFCVAVLT